MARDAQLRRTLAAAGIPPDPSLLVSLSTRLLREGSSPATDRLFADFVDEWNSCEARLGVDIDPRTFALAYARDARIDAAVQAAPANASAQVMASWRYSVVAGVLWARGAQVRAETLRQYHPFAQQPESDRLLVVSAIDRPPRIALERDDWFAELARILTRHGTAELVAPAIDPVRIADALLRIAGEPIDADTLLVHARLIAVRRDGPSVIATVELPEAAQ